MNIYFISGLGADRKAFEKIILPSHFVIHHLDWIKPYKNETLRDYSKRLSGFIDTEQDFVLVGLSFGGMIATAMNEFVRPKKTILISSIWCRKQLPFYMKLAGKLRLHKMVPVYFLSRPNKLMYWMFGAKDISEKLRLNEIAGGADPEFTKWALHAILNWKNANKPTEVIQIHGRLDKILPLDCVKPDHIIENGSHFMVWAKAVEVSKVLEKIISN